MDVFNIDDEQAYSDYVEYLLDNKPEVKSFDSNTGRIETSDCVVMAGDYFGQVFEIVRSYSLEINSDLRTNPEEKTEALKYDPLIYGKDTTENIVAIEIVGNEAWLFREVDGVVSIEKRDYRHWMLGNKPSRGATKLEGNQFYKYLKEYDSREEWDEARKLAKKFNLYCVTNPVEGYMVRHGVTFFKNTKIADVSVLSFDIETTGLSAENCETLMITNTFKKQGVLTRKLFAIDEYESEKEMLLAWVELVQIVNPSIILGFNVNVFDFPFLMTRAKVLGITLDLGRDCSPISKEDFTRKKRKDGSQSYDYNRLSIFGRQVIDVFFVAITYDIGRKYSNYKLKNIIFEEGLEKEGRVFVDAAQIKNEWKDLEKRKLIKQYGIEDSDDALKLYELMIPATFYFTQHIPRPFQIMTESATGSQLNSLMVRGYLQKGHSIALPSDAVEYQGAVSFGIPGKYKHGLKLDISSCYPHTILQYEIYDKHKDPDKLLIALTKYFLNERLKNKNQYKMTGDTHFKDMSESMKVGVNSLYGYLGASGLNYNYPKGASMITEKARDIIDKALVWASGKGTDYWKNIGMVEENEETSDA